MKLATLQIRALHAEYLTGVSLLHLGSRNGLTGTWLATLFRRHGLTMKARGHPSTAIAPEAVTALHAEYQAGASAADLALRHGRCGRWLMMRFIAQNLPLKPHGRPRKDPENAPAAPKRRDGGKSAKTGPDQNPSLSSMRPLRLQIPPPSEKELAWRALRSSMKIQPVPEILQGLSR